MSFTCSFHQVCFQPSRRIRFCKMKKKNEKKERGVFSAVRDRCPTRVGHIEFRFLADDDAPFSCHSMLNPKIIPFLAKSNCIYSTRFCFVLRFFEYRGSEILGTLEDIYLLVSDSSFRYFAIIRSLLTVFDRLFMYIYMSSNFEHFLFFFFLSEKILIIEKSEYRSWR